MRCPRALVHYWYPAMFFLINDILKASIPSIITLGDPRSMAPHDSITAKSCSLPRAWRLQKPICSLWHLQDLFPPLSFSCTLIRIQMQTKIMFCLSSHYRFFSSYLIIFVKCSIMFYNSEPSLPTSEHINQLTPAFPPIPAVKGVEGPTDAQ
jgi:hypothetical protein